MTCSCGAVACVPNSWQPPVAIVRGNGIFFVTSVDVMIIQRKSYLYYIYLNRNLYQTHGATGCKAAIPTNVCEHQHPLEPRGRPFWQKITNANRKMIIERLYTRNKWLKPSACWHRKWESHGNASRLFLVVKKSFIHHGHGPQIHPQARHQKSQQSQDGPGTGGTGTGTWPASQDVSR